MGGVRSFQGQFSHCMGTVVGGASLASYAENAPTDNEKMNLRIELSRTPRGAKLHHEVACG